MKFFAFNVFAFASFVAAWNGQISYGSIDGATDVVTLTDYATGSSYSGFITGIGSSAEEV
jgi:hypothetical protein